MLTELSEDLVLFLVDASLLMHDAGSVSAIVGSDGEFARTDDAQTLVEIQLDDDVIAKQHRDVSGTGDVEERELVARAVRAGRGRRAASACASVSERRCRRRSISRARTATGPSCATSVVSPATAATAAATEPSGEVLSIPVLIVALPVAGRPRISHSPHHLRLAHSFPLLQLRSFLDMSAFTITNNKCNVPNATGLLRIARLRKNEILNNVK